MLGRRMMMAAAGSGFDVANSCHFQAADLSKLTRTFGVPTDNEKWALSFWAKRDSTGADGLFYCGTGAKYLRGKFLASDKIDGYIDNASVTHSKTSTATYADILNWHHWLVVFDDQNATATDQFQIWYDGVKITAWDADSNTQAAGGWGWNRDTSVNNLGYDTSGYFDGYFAEIVFIDGQALGASSFGETRGGSWLPIDVSGLTFGNNGFYLDFQVVPGTGNGAGTDVSGNTNHWTDVNLVAGDQSTNTPTNPA